MAVAALNSFTVKLGGTPLTVIPDPTVEAGEGGTAYTGAYMAQDATLQLAKRDVPLFLRRFSRGAGFVERRDDGDDDGYAWAEDMAMWGGNGAIPSGRRQSVGSGYGLGANATNSVVTDSAVFDGHLWAISPLGHCFRWPSANPTSTPVFSPALNAFGSATTSFRTGYVPKAMAVFADDTGTPALYVSTFNNGTGDTRMYEYTVAGGWAEGGVLGYRADRMAVCYWEGKDGAGAERLHIQTGDSTLRHCISGSDPLVGASYVTPITVGNPGYPITALVASPQHLYVVKKNGIHDVNEIRTWNITPYWEETATLSFSGAALIYDDHIYAGRGLGLDRYDLRLNGAQQRISGECGPGFGWQDGTPIVGYITDIATHDGWLLAAIYNPYNQKSYVGRAKDRRTLNIDVPSPLVWHWAEQVISSGDVSISHLRVTPNASSSFGSQSNYLWMFGAVGYSGLPTADLYYAPLPFGSGPLAAQVSGGSFTYNPTGRLYLTAQNWGDRNAQKGVRRYDMANRKTTATSTLALKSRADGDPLTITDQTTWTTQGTATSDGASITPTSGVTGRSIALQVVATTPSPYTAPPIFHELSPRARVVREVFDVRYLWVVLERDYPLRSGAPDIRNPDATFAAIVALQNSPATAAFVDEKAASYTVYVEQGITYRRAQVSANQYRTVARVELSLVA